MDLVRTKLIVPPTRPGWIARPQLVARLKRPPLSGAALTLKVE